MSDTINDNGDFWMVQLEERPKKFICVVPRAIRFSDEGLEITAITNNEAEPVWFDINGVSLTLRPGEWLIAGIHGNASDINKLVTHHISHK